MEGEKQDEECIDATRVVAARQTPRFQPSFSQPTNPSANLPGNASFTRTNVMQPTMETHQAPRSASFTSQTQGEAGRGNFHASRNQVAIFADEEEKPDELYLMMDSEDLRFPVEVVPYPEKSVVPETDVSLVPNGDASPEFVDLLDANQDSRTEVESEPSLAPLAIDSLKQFQSQGPDMAK